MYNSFQLAKKYFRYYTTAFNGKGHGMHSPFVFDFIVNVLNNKQKYRAPQTIEALRRQLLHNQNIITVEDFGAGSRVQKSSEKKIAQIARVAVKPKKYSRFLFRLVKHYSPQQVIELGTSLGVSTAYMAAANPAANIITIEGSEAINRAAHGHFKKLGLENINAVQGNFDTVLPAVLATMDKVDLAYIDGNHRLVPTLDYFHQLLEKAHPGSIFIFDDIHWSAEMEEAWQTVCQHPSVQCSINIFFMGIVFFRTEFKTKQHFTIRF